MKEYKIYSGGKFISTNKELKVENPYNQEILAKTFLATQEEFEIATQGALEAKSKMHNLPSYKKYKILMEIHYGLENKKEKIAKVLAQESGKPLFYAISEVERAAQTFLVAAEESKRIPNEEVIRMDWTPAGEGKVGIVKQFPIGLVAGIAPFNFPLNLAVHKIAPAIASGCPIVLKPASSTPLSCLELAKIIDETELPKGAVSILPMDRNTGNNLVTDGRYNLLTFTGSPEIGWEMKKNAGEKKVVLELGGNAGVIISENYKIEKTIPSCLIGGFSYSGQICIHAQRYFVHEKHFDGFLSKMKDGIENIKIGNPVDSDVKFSSMIDEKNAIRIEEWVNEAINSGADLITGGIRKGTYYAPTILTNVDKQCKVVAEEVFGPVVVIEKFKDFAQAVNQINDSKFGLQAGVYTNNINEINYAFKNIEAGGVIHNNIPTFRVDHMPYGGIKQSGIGREGVKYAMSDMMEPKILVMESI